VACGCGLLVIALSVARWGMAEPSARARAEALIRDAGSDDVGSILRLGREALGGFAAGDVQLATELFRLAVEHEPGDAAAWTQLGEAQARLDEPGAETSLRRALSLEPGRAAAPASLAALLGYMDRSDAGLALLEAALRDDPSRAARADLLAGLAALRIQRGELEAAIGILEERRTAMLPVGPDLPMLDHPYWNEHLLANLWLSAGHVDEAERISEAAAAAAEAGGSSDEARGAIRSDRSHFATRIAFARGDLGQARRVAAPLRDGNPNGFGSLMSEVLVAEGQPAAALRIVQELCEDGYYRRFNEARALLALGRAADARRKLREVVEWRQLGAWYWLHEYALVRREALLLLQGVPGTIAGASRPAPSTRLGETAPDEPVESRRGWGSGWTQPPEVRVGWPR